MVGSCRKKLKGVVGVVFLYDIDISSHAVDLEVVSAIFKMVRVYAAFLSFQL